MKQNALTESSIHQQPIKKNRKLSTNLCSGSVGGTRTAWLASGRRSRITFTPLSPGADRAARGRRPRTERGKRHPPSRHSEKRAMFTQMRAETRAVASLPFAFRSAAYWRRTDLLLCV